MIRRAMVLRARTAMLVMTAAVLAGGCGGEPAPVTDRDATLRLTMDEYRFVPQNITVQATRLPMRIHVVARNDGELTHNVVIEAIEPDGEQGTKTQATPPFMTTDTAHPGQTVSDDVFLWPGEYRITCTIGNHDNLGMYGKLIVVKPKA